MTKTESAHLTAQTMLLESAEQVLQLHGEAGVRLAIPNTNNLIMVGPTDWIAKNVPGVGAVVASAEPVRTWCERAEESGMRGTEHACMLAEIAELRARLAATTQASTAQAEPVAWMDPTAGCVMDAFLWQKDAANPQYSQPVFATPVTATSSTDAQAGAKVRDTILDEAIAVIPGGSICDPQQVADAIRALRAGDTRGAQ